MTDDKEMRAAFWAWVEDQGCDSDGAWSAWQGAYELAEQDAKRYRWLVENANIETATWAHYGLDPASTKQPLDNAIDAAIDAAAMKVQQ